MRRHNFRRPGRLPKENYLLYDDVEQHYHVIVNITYAMAKTNVFNACKKSSARYDTHRCEQTCSDFMASPPCVRILCAGNSYSGEGARGFAIQFLHLCSKRCAASLAHDLLYALHINLFAITPLIFTIT